MFDESLINLIYPCSCCLCWLTWSSKWQWRRKQIFRTFLWRRRFFQKRAL